MWNFYTDPEFSSLEIFSNKMKIEHVWQAVFVIVGALASAYGGYWVGNQPESVGALQFRIATDEGLKSIFGRSDDVRLIYKEVEQTDISRVTVQVANTTNKNVENVRIYLEVKDKSRPAIISDFTVPDGYPRDIVKVLPSEGGVYSFNVEYMNRTPEFWDGFRFTLYFSGEKPPDVGVKVGSKGLTIKPHEFGESSVTDRVVRVIGATWWFFLLYIGGIFFLHQYNEVAKVLHIEHVKATIANMLSKPSPEEAEKDAVIDQVRKEILTRPNFSTVIGKLIGKRK